MDDDKLLRVLSVEWKQLADDGLGSVELILETDYEGFRLFENAIDGVHRTAISGRSGDDLVITQPVVFRIVNKTESRRQRNG